MNSKLILAGLKSRNNIFSQSYRRTRDHQMRIDEKKCAKKPKKIEIYNNIYETHIPRLNELFENPSLSGLDRVFKLDPEMIKFHLVEKYFIARSNGIPHNSPNKVDSNLISEFIIRHHLKSLEIFVCGHILVSNKNEVTSDKLLTAISSMLDSAGSYISCTENNLICSLHHLRRYFPENDQNILDFIRQKHNETNNVNLKRILNDYLLYHYRRKQPHS
ncbi:hypothetical protein ACFL57_00385 [Candidatus Margulisiibacteriota bacterium]